MFHDSTSTVERVGLPAMSLSTYAIPKNDLFKNCVTFQT